MVRVCVAAVIALATLASYLLTDDNEEKGDSGMAGMLYSLNYSAS